MAHVSLVKGIPFYGYHVGFHAFLKVYLLNPLYTVRLADLLRQGTIMRKPIQPFESHLQYIPQWMCDYNLFGCAYLDCSKVMFRAPVPEYGKLLNQRQSWHHQTIPSGLILDSDAWPRQSHCSIEIDVCVQDILNRLDVKERPLHHDFIEKANLTTEPEKLVHSMAGLWRDETRRRRARLGLDDKSSPFPPDVLVSVSADARDSQPGGWIHEEQYGQLLQELAGRERSACENENLNFHDFVRPRSAFEGLKTAFQSVEDLFPSNLGPAQLAPRPSQDLVDSRQGAIEVDEKRILSIGTDDLAISSDDEMASGALALDELVPDTMQHRVARDLPQVIASEADPPNQSPRPAPGPPAILEDSARDGQASLSVKNHQHGLRDIGDYLEIEDLSFPIPEEYGSEIARAAERYRRTGRRSPEHNRKRRKVFHDEQERSDQSSVKSRLSQLSRTPGLEEKIKIEAFHVVGYQDMMAPDHPLEKQIPNDASGIFDTSSRVADVRNPRTSAEALELSLAMKSIDSSDESHAVEWGGPQTTSHVALDSKVNRPPELELLSSRLHEEFAISADQELFVLVQPPPSPRISLQASRVPTIVYQEAHYSDEIDVPERPREYAGKEFRLESTGVSFLPDFDVSGQLCLSTKSQRSDLLDRAQLDKAQREASHPCTLSTWEIVELPPTMEEVSLWLQREKASGQCRDSARPARPPKRPQNEDFSQNVGHGYNSSKPQESTSVKHETQYMSLMSLEVHVNTRGTLVPNPEEDEIACIFWCLQANDQNSLPLDLQERNPVGMLVLSDSEDRTRQMSHATTMRVEVEDNELDLINRVIDLVRAYDPDILTGFEVHGGSWGYLIERARCKYDYGICNELSRMKSQSHGRFGKENDKWGFNQTSTIRITGRHMINIWRAIRGEVNLLQYTMENIIFHILRRRIPHYSFADLTKWYTSGRPRDLAKVMDYFSSRVRLDLEILDKNELVPRTSEQARLLGVDFFSVFARGSQLKVECLMLRIAKPENFILISPSRKQVGQQNALECLPLVMEPQSNFYTSPVLVLDFQSLYPSVMIAYNYCYSTFLGRLVNWRGQNKMGFTDFKREAGLLGLLEEHINIAPNGMMYTKPEVRKSLLAKMLGEILETRVMVKSGMKVDREDRILQRLLNNRQLALKLIANVTYGYTSASFSGRMPCSEIADSIVQTARETLEKAIALIHSVGKWDAEVVYGDTDSLFVHLKGRSRDEAFDIGEEIAKTVTDMNPRPMKLKFEKVYHPCVLLAKKRYVGFKYESKTQVEPEFDAKGIETVRRDGTPAEQKIEEKALKILFRTADLSRVKEFFQEQCSRIMRGRVSIQDFCFAREVKLGTYNDRGPPPPGALISTKRMLEDPRAEPQYGERVPFVIITGAPGARLIDRCVAPEVLLGNDQNELDAEYYITKNIIPPLERIFNLVGANVRQWYDEMPKFQRIRDVDRASLDEIKELALANRKTMESYMKSSTCVVCRSKLATEATICVNCEARPAWCVFKLRSRLKALKTEDAELQELCRSCSGFGFVDEVKCDSKDCPVFYTRTRHRTDWMSKKASLEPVLHSMEEVEETLEW